MAYKRLVSGPKPIGSLTPAELDAKLAKGRLYFVSSDLNLCYSITRDSRTAAPYLVMIDDGDVVCYHKQYTTLARLMESEPFDLSKFSYERK